MTNPHDYFASNWPINYQNDSTLLFGNDTVICYICQYLFDYRLLLLHYFAHDGVDIGFSELAVTIHIGIGHIERS